MKEKNPFSAQFRPSSFQKFHVPRLQDSRHMKVVRLSCLCTSHFHPQKIFLVLTSVRGWVNPRAIVWLEGLCERKIPMTPSRIKPATFRLVAWCLNQLFHCVPQLPVMPHKILNVAAEWLVLHSWCMGLGDHILFMLGVWCWVITFIMILIPSHWCPKFFVVFFFMSRQLWSGNVGDW